MTYLVVIEKVGNSFGAYLSDLPGCAVVGETREEVLQLIREAVDLHVSSLKEHGDPPPEAASTGVCAGLAGESVGITVVRPSPPWGRENEKRPGGWAKDYGQLTTDNGLLMTEN